MRPIKFRAWNKKLKIYSGVELFIDKHGVRDCGALHAQDVVNRGDEYVIEQFTGLTDKNGKEIYEGDIVLLNTLDKGEVVYHEDSFVVRIGGESMVFHIPYHKSEVIGNIHENPELLK